MEMQELVNAVMDHAEKNYNKDGWDYVVETMDRRDIAELIGEARSSKAAIAKVKKIAKLLNDRRREVEATIW